MSKRIEQQAADIIKEHAVPAAYDIPAALSRATAALSRAGLLVNPRDVLCRKLADAAADYFRERDSWSGIKSGDHKWDALCAESRALLAYDREHSPKPRYVVRIRPGKERSLAIEDTHTKRFPTDVRGIDVATFCNLDRAEAECAALNALAEKEAGR